MSTSLHTKAFLTFLEHEIEVRSFLAIANIGAAGIPLLKKHAPQEDPRLADQLERLWKGLVFLEKPNLFRQLWVEMMLTHTVDSFNVYLSDVLYSVFKARPEILRSNEQTTIQKVLEFGSMDEFINYWAIRKVDELSYGGFFEVKKFLTKKIGLEDNFDEKELQGVVEAIAFRNIIVHNRGRVNERFLRDCGRQDFKLGDEVNLSRDEAGALCQSIENITRFIDSSLISKFGEKLFAVGANAEN